MTAIQAIEEQPMQAPVSKAGSIPTLPTGIKDAENSKELMRIMRHFFLGDPVAREQVAAVDGDFLPALMNPFRDVSKVRYDYPLFLYSPVGRRGGPLAKPLSQYLRDTVEGFAAGADAAKILKDNLAWLERNLRQELSSQEAPVTAEPLFAKATDALQQHLNLTGENQARLQGDLEKFLKAVKKANGQLLGYSKYVAIQLMGHAVRSHVVPRRVQFQGRVSELIKGLRNLLEVEHEKTEAATKPEAVKSSVGGAGKLFDASALSAVIKKHSHGSISMKPEQRARVEAALKTLKDYAEDPIALRLIHNGRLAGAWLEQTSDITAVVDADPCTKATELFDIEAAKLAKIIAAARIADLEIKGLYDPQIHDAWFANFNWEGFSQDEMLLLPAVVAVDAADRIGGEGMASFSRLLTSGRPIQILVRVQAHNNPGAAADEDPFQRFRVELGYLGISHRQATITQSSAARYEHLLERFVSALDATRTSLHLISTGVQTVKSGAALDPWFVASAALEGRAHPFFHVNPEAGDEAADRMDFSGNPQPEMDWPLHGFRYKDESGETLDIELPFTFGDYALLVPRLRDHFGLVPVECESDDLIPLGEYLALMNGEVQKAVPFIWAINSLGVLRKLVVSRALVLACRDRRNYWRTLQEMAGVRNRYVELAVERAQEEAQAAARAAIDRAQAEANAEIERVRVETAGEVLGRLAEGLVGMDLSAAAMAPVARSAAPAAAPAAVPAIAAVPTAAAEAAVEEEEEEVSFNDPYIDSFLCTSCNDCLVINPLMFVYNENNQAFIADANAGTYSQLVDAAEICPAKCIHPGQPLNPNEPDLEELKQRAAPFN
jgi:ferredoxin